MSEREFKGECFGVRLFARGPDDPHVLVSLIVEDDGQWFPAENGLGSSFWLPEVIDVLTSALQWMKRRCDPDVSDGTQYGWRFRSPASLRKPRKRKPRPRGPREP